MKSTRRTRFASLEVVKLGRSEWRIVDAADHERVLGFIERQRGGRFEILWMSDPIRWGYSDSFDSAIVAFGDSLLFTGEVFPQRVAQTRRAAASLGRTRAVTPSHRATWTPRTDHSSVA